MKQIHLRFDKDTLHAACLCAGIFVIMLLGVYFFLDGPADISGALILEETTIRTNFTFVEPKNASRADAVQALLAAEETVHELQRLNLTVFYVNDTLLNAKRAFIGPDKTLIYADIAKENDSETRKYVKTLAKVAETTPAYEVQRVNLTKVFMFTQLVAHIKEQIFRINDITPVLEKKAEEYERQRIDVAYAKEVIAKAKKSFTEERYDEAEAYLREATLQMDKARAQSRIVRGLAKLGRGVIKRYWLPASILVIICASFLPTMYVRWKKKHAAKKVVELEHELETLKKLLRKAQQEYFKEQKITKQTYDILTERYRERITTITSRIPALKAVNEGKKQTPQRETTGEEIGEKIRFNAPAGEKHGKNKTD